MTYNAWIPNPHDLDGPEDDDSPRGMERKRERIERHRQGLALAEQDARRQQEDAA